MNYFIPPPLLMARGPESRAADPKAAAPDDIWQGENSGLPRHTEAAIEIVPERNAQISKGLGEAEEGIATGAPANIEKFADGGAIDPV